MQGFRLGTYGLAKTIELSTKTLNQKVIVI